MSTEDPTTPSDQPELDPLGRVRDEDPERPAESAEGAGSAEQTAQIEPSVSAPTPAAELLGDPDLGGDPNLLGSVDVTDEPAEVAGASADRPEELLDAPVSEQTPEQTEQTEPALDHRAHAAAAAAGPVMAPTPTAGAAQPGESTQSTQSARSSGSSHPATLVAQHVADLEAQMGDHEGASLVRSTWRWAAATVILFPLFALWTLPSAAMTSRAVGAGDLAGARNEASLARLLGLISVVLFLVFAVLWLVMVIIAAAAGADAASTGVTLGTRVSTA